MVFVYFCETGRTRTRTRKRVKKRYHLAQNKLVIMKYLL